MGSTRRSKRSSGFAQRLFRRWLAMAAVGAVVGGALVLSDEEKRRQVMAKARELSEQAKKKLSEQWPTAPPRVQEWMEQGRLMLEPGPDQAQPEG